MPRKKTEKQNTQKTKTKKQVKPVKQAAPVVEPDIQDLYIDYSDRLEGIEKNRYFKYLYELVKASDNKFYQSNQILHKVVDESWLKTIEDSLDAINRIINKPRKFITTREEVVPVGLAKKITADSIKHLSKNTQFIVSEPGEPVKPTKILNSSMEETYDLYENRFVYHLIQRLVRFIDKRTDVIFWSTGDETRNKLIYESQVDDAFEQISYKVEMTIKNLQSFAENDADNMEVFARIDRVRRLVMSIRASSFCSIMTGCAAVRSPIQRTNLMIKDPDYRTAYRLWNFLESYDEVGYTIDVIDNVMAFDDDYVNKMFTNLVSQYTTFKSIIETDDRVLNDELRHNLELAKAEKKLKPKFIHEIQEEEVDSPDLPDVEIRRVFVEEVTEAQLAAEAKAEECEKAMLAAQEAQKEAEKKVREAEHKVEQAESRAKEAVDKNDAMTERVEKFRILAENAEKAKKNAEEQAVADLEQARKNADEEKAKALAEAASAAKEELKKTRTEAAAKVSEATKSLAKEKKDRAEAERTAARLLKAKNKSDSDRAEALFNVKDANSKRTEAVKALKDSEKKLNSLTDKYAEAQTSIGYLEQELKNAQKELSKALEANNRLAEEYEKLVENNKNKKSILKWLRR